MRFSDIKIGHIYYADLTPVRPYEFGDNHLCIVLEKCSDKRSVVIVSLTSKSSGLGNNKEELVVPGLPKRLTTDKHNNPITTYVVFDQVRTVVSNRLQYIYDGKENGKNKIVEPNINPAIYKSIINKLADLKIKNLSSSEQVAYHKDNLFKLTLNALLEDLFSVIKGTSVIEDVSKNISEAYTLLTIIEHDFSIKNHIKEEHEDKIQKVLADSLKEKQLL